MLASAACWTIYGVIKEYIELTVPSAIMFGLCFISIFVFYFYRHLHNLKLQKEQAEKGNPVATEMKVITEPVQAEPKAIESDRIMIKLEAESPVSNSQMSPQTSPQASPQSNPKKNAI